MKTLEFVKKHGYFFDHNTKNSKLIDLYPYQKDILNTFDENEVTLLLSPRQMGVSHMLVFNLANFIINNDSDRNIYYFITNNYISSMEIIDKVKLIINQYQKENSELLYTNNSRIQISLSNGNTIKILSDTEDGLRGINFNKKHESIDTQWKPFGLIVDNAGYCKSLKYVYENICRKDINLRQVIMCSSLNNKYNFFYDELFNKECEFKKIKLNWYDNPNFTKEWYKNIKLIYCKNMYEIDLVRTQEPKEPNKPNKNRVITIRLDDDTIDKLTNKLIETDLSISEYIRHLVKKDI